MSKKRKKAGSQPKAPPTKAATQPQPRKGILRYAASLLSPSGLFWTSVTLFFTLVGGYCLLRPQIVVEPDATLDAAQIMITRFKITNSGQTPLYNLKRQLFPRQLRSDHINWYSQPGATAVIDSYPAIPVLGSGESTSVSNPFLVMGITNGDVEIALDYTTAIIPIHQTKRYRFVTGRAQNGDIMWFHKAISE